MITGGVKFMVDAPWLYWVPSLAIPALVVPWLILADAMTERFRIYGRLPWNDVVS
jgi:hypothetical protein